MTDVSTLPGIMTVIFTSSPSDSSRLNPKLMCTSGFSVALEIRS